MDSIALQKMANTIRILAIDAVQKARSGHPGMPMGMAEIGATLWGQNLKHHPKQPGWHNRDRCVVSNGHGSMLLYAALHLTGYDLSMDDIQAFRQLHSKTPGHPEYAITPGVETTTGPLGQGLANAVGMALAEKLLAHEFNTPDLPIIDHHTYVLVGDGCLMEGISHEVCALAGVWNLEKLIVLYDDNNISIDGKVDDWFADNTPKRFKAYGWDVIEKVDGHSIQAIDAAIQQAKTHKNPTLICCKTVIGKGSPTFEGTEKIHGAPLGDEEIARIKNQMGWTLPAFSVDQADYALFDQATQGQRFYDVWQIMWQTYQTQYPEKAAELTRRWNKQLPEDWSHLVGNYLEKVLDQCETIATRKASQNSITAYSALLPELLGGSADLTGSNLTNGAQAISFHPQTSPAGNYLHYGVREFGMCAIMNGIALYGAHIPFGGTFLTFSDYARNAIRMAALMKIRSIFVLTHDSIALGEDGPTHQPVEHIASLQMIPNLSVWRPADALETAMAWKAAIERTDGPTALILSRQNIAPIPQSCPKDTVLEKMSKGAYLFYESVHMQKAQREPKETTLTILASGAEVHTALEVANLLERHDGGYVCIRVISVPSRDTFLRQDADYQKSVLGSTAKIAIEAGVTDLWHAFGVKKVFGIHSFGESAPADQLFKHFGLDAQSIADHIIANL